MNTPNPQPATLLLAVTDSERDRHAALQGVALAASLGAAVVAVSVVPQFEGGMSLLHFKDHMAEVEAPHRAVLDWVRQEAAKANVPCTIHLETGVPFEVLTDLADRCHAGWIVLGGGREALPGTSFLGGAAGPTTGRVIGYARRETLIIPEGARTGFSRLLLCLDGSACSERAAARALALARTYGSAIIAAAVVDVPAEYHLYEKIMLELFEKSRSAVDRFRHQAAEAGVSVEGYVRHGDAAETILELASETKADLLIMGSHGRTGLSRLLMGSVVEEVLRRVPAPATPAPVLVVP
ncbi:universal stress protein [Megalodesulfovibrio paquesii]